MSDELRYRDRIVRIARRPACNRVFGVLGSGNWAHRFDLTRHSHDESALLEEQLGVNLPEDYKQLLVETGSGAGPYYGLFDRHANEKDLGWTQNHSIDLARTQPYRGPLSIDRNGCGGRSVVVEKMVCVIGLEPTFARTLNNMQGRRRCEAA